MYRDPDAAPSILLVAFNGRVWALERTTGAVVWKYAFDSPSAWTRVSMHGDRVIITATGAAVCLDAHTGKERWRAALPIRHVGTLMVTASQIFVAGAGEVVALDLDGRIQWHEPFRGQGLEPVGLAIDGISVQADHA